MARRFRLDMHVEALVTILGQAAGLDIAASARGPRKQSPIPAGP
jgi:hypothetical protein